MTSSNLRRLHHRQVGGLGALEDAADLRQRGAEETDYRHHRLLRARRERPRGRRAAEQRDELAFFSIDRIAFGPPVSEARIAAYRTGGK